MADTFFNEKAEQMVISAFLTDSDCQKDIPRVTSEMFFNPDYKSLFEAIQSLFMNKKTIDLVMLSEELRVRNNLDEPRLTTMAVKVVTESGIVAKYRLKDHIEVLSKLAIRRRFYDILGKAKESLMLPENDTGAVLESTRQALRDIVTTNHSWKSMNDVLMETFETLERRSRGEEEIMPSGISTLDKCTTGFHKGELTIIGARPAVGKSALGAHIALMTAQNGYKVGICSREMTTVQYGTRILSRDADIDNQRMRTGELDPEDWAKISQALGLYANMNIAFMFSTRFVEDLRMEVQKKVDSNELDMLVVDYLQLLQTRQKFEKDYLRIGYISKMLKDMTTDFNISVIALAQVGRGSEGAMPTLAELRGSGDIEQDADNVIFMHKPSELEDKYIHPQDKELFQTLQENGMQYMALGVAKQRQGETGVVSVVFNPSRMRFTAIDRGDGR